MRKSLKWQAYSNKNRNEVIQKVKDIISQCDGYITHFNIFSDLALNLSIEIEGNKSTDLRLALQKVVNITVNGIDNVESHSNMECLINLNISFGQGTGKLKMDIPDVPG